MLFSVIIIYTGQKEFGNSSLRFLRLLIFYFRCTFYSTGHKNKKIMYSTDTFWCDSVNVMNM
jgi:hypothetical protein